MDVMGLRFLLDFQTEVGSDKQLDVELWSSGGSWGPEIEMWALSVCRWDPPLCNETV